MAWRFKASKYKNAAPIVPKPEACIRDVVVGSYQTYGNNIAASAAFMAFNWEHTGSSLAVLPIDDCGRKSKSMPLLHAHSDTVTDIDFSSFHDGLLATASQDCLVKIWHIPEKGLENSLSEPECTFSHKQRRVETVGFHPTADFLLYSTSGGNINLWDITTQKEIFSNNEHPEVIQSLCWKQDGTLLATSCKDKVVRILDPRKSSAIQMSADSHQSIKDSRIVWLGDQNRVLTTGFDAARLRQVIIRDLRNFNTPEKTLELDCSTGILMPLFDPDTNMLFLAGKGDTTITYMEVTDKDPYLIEGLRHTGEQTKGACLVPKRALKVMEGEVNRILQLTSNSVIPIMYQVPRKTYRDFHSDLYPDTSGFKTELTASQWLNGTNITVPKISLDPSKRDKGDSPIVIHRGNLKELIKNLANKQSLKSQNGKLSSHENTTDRVINKRDKNSDSVDNLKSSSSSLTTTIPCKIDIIKKFDNKYKTESEKDIMMTMVMNSQKNLTRKIVESANTTTTSSFSDLQNDDNDDTINKTSTPTTQQYHQQSPPLSVPTHENQIDDGGIRTEITTPPKPLPRTSRNNSISDQQQQVFVVQQQNNEDNNNTTTPILSRPIARPRMTTASYKPRLGPKPFTSNSVDVSFDKVFSVPQAPGQQDSEFENQQNSLSSSLQTEKKPEFVEIHIKKQNEIKNGEKYNFEKDDCNDDGPKSLTTSERRKSADESELFESNNSESSGNSTEGEDKSDSELKRLSSNRSSIAERRRMYENRSKSVQEEKPQSPVPLIRRDSFKNPNETPSSKHSIPTTPADNKRSSSVNETKSVEIRDEKRKSSDILRKPSSEPITATKRTSTVFGKVSKFRHLKGTPAHKSTHIENLRNISRQIPGECNGFHANYERVAVPLSGPGGKIAIFELNKPGRLPDGVIPSLVNGCNIMDFQWDPFDTTRLAVACDDGIVKFWHIPDGGLQEPTNEPESELIAHLDKIYFIRFHPLAKDVFLTASYDMTIKLWNLKTMKEMINLKGHTEQIFDYAWSPCGVYGATVSKDGKIRVYNPRKNENPIREGNGPSGSRGARITWAIEGQYLLVTGFDKVSERQISVYNSHNLAAPLNTVSLDVSPAILIPFYDEDSSVLFATGKGDSTIYVYEITDEEPYIVALSHHRCFSLHQGLSFLSKNHCDVANVEFAKALRLTNNTIEPLSFTVPRIKSELFQDDLFPPTQVTWTPTMTSDDWFAMNDKRPKKISLQPEGMECLSSFQPSTPATVKKIDSSTSSSSNNFHHAVHRLEDAKAKQIEIQKSISARLEYTNAPLEQDSMEGVDEAEWED